MCLWYAPVWNRFIQSSRNDDDKNNNFIVIGLSFRCRTLLDDLTTSWQELKSVPPLPPDPGALVSARSFRTIQNAKFCCVKLISNLEPSVRAARSVWLACTSVLAIYHKLNPEAPTAPLFIASLFRSTLEHCAPHGWQYLNWHPQDITSGRLRHSGRPFLLLRAAGIAVSNWMASTFECLWVKSCLEGSQSGQTCIKHNQACMKGLGSKLRSACHAALSDTSFASMLGLFSGFQQGHVCRPRLEDMLEDYWRLMPEYQQVKLDDLTPQRILFGNFPTYRQSPLPPVADRILQVGDASGVQSPLSFGGFGALMRYLPRLKSALLEALEVIPVSLMYHLPSGDAPPPPALFHLPLPDPAAWIYMS